MKRFLILGAALLVTGCAHLGLGRSESDARRLWNDAHAAFAQGDHAGAISLFDRLAREHAETPEGYESLFYLGTLHLDPRNPEWNPEPAREALDRYLAGDFDPYEPRHHKWPEAQVLQQLAKQLTMPAEERLPALQPETRREVVRVVVPAAQSRSLQAEVNRLREAVAARDRKIEAQEQELARIRKALTGKN